VTPTPACIPLEPEYDVAIVGSGPGGGAAALELAGRGLRVALLEKARLPRYKTCGGGVLWRAAKLLPADISSAVDRDCDVAELIHHAPDLRFACRRPHPIVRMVMRDQFDALLANTAASRGGVTLHDATAVQSISVSAGSVHVATNRGDFEARFLIAADGVMSTIARALRLPNLRNVVPALECEAKYPDAIAALHGTAARFDFGLIPAGYGWVFPKRHHLSIGVGTTKRGRANLPVEYERYLQRLNLPRAEREERHGYMIPCLPRARMFDAPRVLFVGDAAGLADPVTAEGITGSIMSGQLAARAILAHRDDARRATRMYRDSVDRALLRDLRIARVLAWILYDHPRWSAKLLKRHGHGMSELMTRIVTGEATYRAAVRRPAHYVYLLFGRR
jgi:geranylgeranyl reductase family protein